MKILFYLLDKYPPFRVDVAVLVFKKAIERGCSVDCIIQSEQKQSRFVRYDNRRLVVYSGPATARTHLLSRLLNKVLYLINDLLSIRLLLKHVYDVMLVKDKFISALPLLFYASLFKVPYIYWLSYPFPEDALHRARTGTARFPTVARLKGAFTRWLLYKILLPRSRHAFVQTAEMKRRIQAQGISAHKMSVLPMGCELEKIPYIGSVSESPMKTSGFKLGYMGSLSRVRRVDFLLRALVKILKRVDDVALYLIGAGDETGDETAIESMAADLGIANQVKLTGFMPQKQAWEMMKRVHICLSHLYPDPIYDVGFPTKLIEYMALGKAVVANTHIEQIKILKASKAGLCVPYDEGQFAEAIVYLIKNPSLLEPLGRNGRRYVETNYNYNTIADHFYMTLVNCCGK